ncbi:unnamed protein product [[Candida] boidinii]|uniref:Unnamed protein product n=1 Tax=Candida boidinii TaxID=5477 RepID=A0ACB5U8J3_CANBO|nr:unnamed protein product [[Candida] boidinii]
MSHKLMAQTGEPPRKMLPKAPTASPWIAWWSLLLRNSPSTRCHLLHAKSESGLFWPHPDLDALLCVIEQETFQVKTPLPVLPNANLNGYL